MTLLSAGTGLGIGFQGGASKTYAQFQAHIAGVAPTTITWSSTTIPSAVSRRVTAAGATGAMTGTSWTAIGFRSDSTVARVVQHGLPSQAVFDSQVINSGEMVIQFGTTESIGSYFSDNRNGYTSVASGSPANGNTISDLIYWDFALSAAFRMNPSAGTGPTPYVF